MNPADKNTKALFVAIRWVDVTYFSTAYEPGFYRPTSKPEEKTFTCTPHTEVQ